MPDRSTILIAVAVGTLVAPVLFLAALAVAGWRRSRGAPVGPRLATLVTVLGGIAVGMLLVMSGSLVVGWPLLLGVLVLVALEVRRGRIREAGWLLAGTAAPWTFLWAVYLAALYLRLDPFDPYTTWLGFIVGAVPMLLGLTVAVARRLPDPSRGVLPPAPQRARSLTDVPAAIDAPSMVGPFRLPDVAMLVALVVTWLAGSLLLPPAVPAPIRLTLMVLASAALGTEAFIRARPAPTLEAFEAFSWLGEQELAAVRAQTGEPMPTDRRTARQWLLAHADQPGQRWVRVEVAVLAGHLEEARALAGRMPDATPDERFARAAAMDFADWFAGGPGDLEAMERAAEDLEPTDENARLRAAVSIALATVRRRVAAGVDPLEAGAPLREVRRRLGSRADGQLGRTLRWRTFRVTLLVGLVVGATALASEVLTPLP